ncbi:MAG TPA: NAD(P)/FAD-dependent oxidoreductase [Moraxellaceae bacterium]|nr:NAD(P)/FAD-dependent oxidoreductase [Moraxellaceae bacterium]
MKRTGRRYRTGRADDHYDTIVIGSGIGGLCNAALLSKLGKKVCVLEQHYTAGGFTHSYEREGFEWDVGVHYIGEMQRPTMLKRIFDVISDGNLKWADMDPVYDRIIIGDRSVDFIAGKKNLADSLKSHFPEDAEAIDAYIALVTKVAASAQKFYAGKAMPRLAARAYHALRPLLVPKECFMTVRDVLEGLTKNQELIGILVGQWGDYGMVPAEASFMMHTSVVKHYFNGGSYPVGGSWKMADTIIPIIRAGGGEVFTYARVKQILIEKGRATGVIMENGDTLRADTIVSDAGATITFNSLLPEAERQRYGYANHMKKVKPSSSHLCLYAGFKGTAKDLNIPRTNFWIYPSADHEGNLERFQANPDAEFPMLYISFPSAKDPEWDGNYPNKSTVEVLTFGPWEWFAKWDGTTWCQRGEEYETLKEKFHQRLLDELFKYMPQLKDALVYSELSTPLSTAWFQLNPKGEIYGLDHDVQRFKQEWLHSITPIKGLYLTGQDIISGGVGGALVGGMMTTSAMMGKDAMKVMKLLKDWRPADEGTSTTPTAPGKTPG